MSEEDEKRKQTIFRLPPELSKEVRKRAIDEQTTNQKRFTSWTQMSLYFRQNVDMPKTRILTEVTYPVVLAHTLHRCLSQFPICYVPDELKPELEAICKDAAALLARITHFHDKL